MAAIPQHPASEIKVMRLTSPSIYSRVIVAQSVCSMLSELTCRNLMLECEVSYCITKAHSMTIIAKQGV